MQNPYINKKMLPHDSDMFFGREKEIEEIGSLLGGEQPQCVSIVGERRIGKSSVANRVYHKFKNAENTIAVFLDCGGLSENCTKDDFFRILNREFLGFLKERQDINNRLTGYGENLFEDYPSFLDFIKKECKNSLRFIILMDEFEHLAEINFADRTFFSNLRAMANSPENRLAFVTISRNHLKRLTPEAMRTSEFWNIFTTEIIGLLDDDSIRKLRLCGFEKNNFSLGEEEVSIIEYYAGNFPFFNQIVCEHIFNTKICHDELDRDNLEIGLFPFYETLWTHRTDNEKKLLKKIDEKSLLRELEARGLVKKVNNKIYRPFSAFFLDIINKKQFMNGEGLRSSRNQFIKTLITGLGIILTLFSLLLLLQK